MKRIDSIADLREAIQEMADTVDRSLFGMTEAEFAASPGSRSEEES